VYALDARTGREVWSVKEGDVSKGETFPAAPVAWHGLVYIGNAGGDNFAVTGRMMALDARTGANVWTVDMVPRSGAANATWPLETDRVPRAGGTTWTSYAMDTAAGVLWVATGNAAPDFLESVRPGSNQHAYSLLALDLRTGEIRKAVQLLARDFHDWDMAATPLLVKTAAGHMQVVEAGKDGYLYGIDPSSGSVLYKVSTTTHQNDSAPLTAQGTHFCPGIQGGTEYNGPAYSPQTNMLYVPAVDWCSTIALGAPNELKNKLGLPWTGSKGIANPFGTLDPQRTWSGWLTAYDADRGSVKWRYHSRTPMVAGVTSTAGGLVFTGDLLGNVLGFDARDGSIRFHATTGQPIGGGVVSYAVDGKQYVAVASGLNAPMTWQTKAGAAKVVVFSLP
jgi:glucose dehydrogenase